MTARASLCLFVLWTATACAGTSAETRLVNVTHAELDDEGRALVEADKLYACYERAAHTGALCAGKPVPLADWNARLAAWDTLRDAIARGYKTVLAADVAIHSWHAGDRRRWNAAEPCVTSALGKVRDALHALELTVPPALAAVRPSPCNCMACEDDFYPYGNVLPEHDHCESALSCR